MDGELNDRLKARHPPQRKRSKCETHTTRTTNYGEEGRGRTGHNAEILNTSRRRDTKARRRGPAAAAICRTQRRGTCHCPGRLRDGTPGGRRAAGGGGGALRPPPTALVRSLEQPFFPTFTYGSLVVLREDSNHCSLTIFCDEPQGV